MSVLIFSDNNFDISTTCLGLGNWHYTKLKSRAHLHFKEKLTYHVSDIEVSKRVIKTIMSFREMSTATTNY